MERLYFQTTGNKLKVLWLILGFIMTNVLIIMQILDVFIIIFHTKMLIGMQSIR